MEPNTHDTAIIELGHARQLIAMADGDDILADEIATILMTCRRGKPLPDKTRLVRQLHSGVPNATAITVGEYLTWWVEHRQIDEHTRIGYAAHIRVHLTPGIGHIRLDKLHSTHIEAMFAKLATRNTEILAARASSDLARQASVHGVRLTMPATMTRVKATLAQGAQ